MSYERFISARKEINEIANSKKLSGKNSPYGIYFNRTASFLETVFSQYDFVESGEIFKAPVDELKKRNDELFADILPENYSASYADPVFTVKNLGSDFGKLFSLLYTELRSLIIYAHEKRYDLMLIRMEIFIKIYQAFSEKENKLPEYEKIHGLIYSYVSDNLKSAALEKISGQVTVKNDFAKRIIMESDLSDLRYLYYFGEYITENEIKTAKHLNSLPEETIALMADTYTEGYRKGFELSGKDLKKKKLAQIRYQVGFELVIRKAVDNFAHLGLDSAFIRTNLSILEGRSLNRFGFFGAIANKQFDFDHKDDLALVLDQNLVDLRLEAITAAYEEMKTAAKEYAGPAVMETFGELKPTPAYKKEAIRLSPEQQKLAVKFQQASGEITNRYIPGEEVSYTIIAFPTPEIGPDFPAIFDETIALNTLDYNLYRDIQQIIIDHLDQAEYVKISGCGNNKTELKIILNELADPVSQTNFENCVADVNIPVGEVFTSPTLKGSEGTLHVTRVFLNEMEYKDLSLTIKDGMVTAYNCANFETGEENKKFIKENLLYHHESLPLSEFAIGTNTTAYMAGKKYDISDRLPILIAEKTGPHFAIGDTCFSHAEDIAVFNPDGKEIVARDNEISLLRKSDKSKAYFNCHTDITIPYDELGEITAVKKCGESIPIFSAGKFVLPGCEELNKALEAS